MLSIPLALVNFKNDYELTGAEDPSILTGYVTALSVQDAHREGKRFHLIPLAFATKTPCEY